MPYPVPARQPAPRQPSRPSIRHGEMAVAALTLIVWAVAFVALLTH